MIGITLNDRYEILERIGGGGMANVYKAHDNRLGRDVAIKILKDEFVNDNEFVENFRKESYSAAKLNHPNIVGVFDVGMDQIEDTNCYYIVMEIVNGRTLKDIIDEKGKLSVSETINYSIQICEALLCAHENGIIHRDIKPQNIIINKENIPKVTDFGIAQAPNKNTSVEKDIMGSVHYFSPEQARGIKTDQRSDIYSLGIVMFEMITGRLPFEGDNPISVALKQVHEQIKVPSSLNSDVPQLLDQVILKMTNKDIEKRYNNLKEVIIDLKALESKNDIEMSDTLIIPNVNRFKDKNIDPEEQRRIRRTSIESNSNNRNEFKRQNEVKERKKSSGVLPIIGGILLALIVATAGFFFFIKFSVLNKPVAKNQIEVPMLLGMVEEEARKTVEDLNLKFEVSEKAINHDYGPGEVIYQSVNSGTMVKEGYTIRVQINEDDIGDVEVGSYLGLDLDKAISKIKDDKLFYKVEYEEVEAEEDVDQVIKQDIESGTKVKEGTTVILTVGRAMDVQTVSMPNFLGQNIDVARKSLEDKGLIVKVTKSFSNNFDDGDVIGQSVEAGEEVEVGSEIELFENDRSLEATETDKDKDTDENTEETENTETNQANDNNEDADLTNPKDQLTYNVRLILPEDKESVYIVIKKIENNQEVEVYSGTHYSSEGTVSIPVQGSEDTIFHVYVDGVLQDTPEY